MRCTTTLSQNLTFSQLLFGRVPTAHLFSFKTRWFGLLFQAFKPFASFCCAKIPLSFSALLQRSFAFAQSAYTKSAAHLFSFKTRWFGLLFHAFKPFASFCCAKIPLSFSALLQRSFAFAQSAYTKSAAHLFSFHQSLRLLLNHT